MKKYHYVQGMCAATHLNGLNPVQYTGTEQKGKYQKEKMACACVERGVCERANDCEVLAKAPDVLIDDTINLRNQKLG